MGRVSGISWAPGGTINPWEGCFKWSEGCKFCYAERRANSRSLPIFGPPSTTHRTYVEKAVHVLHSWNGMDRAHGSKGDVFVGSQCDLFEDHPMVSDWRREWLEECAKCTDLRLLFLTKRIENVRNMVPDTWMRAWPQHIILGFSVENQQRANERFPEALGISRLSGCKLFVSLEPQIGPCDISGLLPPEDATRIYKVIQGGESYSEDHPMESRRPFHLEWVLDMAGQLERLGVTHHFKQAGDFAHWRNTPVYLGYHGEDFTLLPEEFLQRYQLKG